METVDCSECGTRYDSDQNPFCPRCGSVRQGAPVPAALPRVARHDPRRRRVRVAGIILMAFGALFAVLVAVPLVAPSPAAMATFVADLPGGTIHVEVEPPGAVGNVSLRALDANGTLLASAALVGGNATLESPDHGAVNVTVATPQGNWSRFAIVLEGHEVTVRFDLGRPAGHEADPVVGAGLMGLARGFAAVVLGLSLLMAGGGVAAFRLRGRGLALAGAVVGLLFGLFMGLVLLLLGLLVGLPLLYALVVILRSRDQFQRAG